MKDQKTNYVEEMIDRYVYQVTKNMNSENAKDIDLELRTLIADMLEEKTKGSPASKADIDSVLLELGNPHILAEKYQSNAHYLISPELYPSYISILKIVFFAVLIGMSVVTVLDLVTSTDAIWYTYISSWVGNMFNSFLSAFGSVTLLFALFERRGIRVKDIVPAWEPVALTPVPAKERRIPLGEPIVGIIFTVIFMIIFVSAPQLFGLYFLEGSAVTLIPVLNMEVFQSVLPLILIIMSLGIVKNTWEIIDRYYSPRYAIFTLIINTVSFILLVILFNGYEIWNPNFAEQLQNAYHLSYDSFLVTLWERFTSTLIIFIGIIYILETVIVTMKSLNLKSGK